MKRILIVLVLVLAGNFSSVAIARDYGQQGAVFAVTEIDLLKTIENKLKALQADGSIDRLNQELLRKTTAKVNRPDPVFGVGKAVETRSWIYDPSMVMDHDVSDTKGNIVARRGQRVNPLDMVTIRQALVFIDGDDAAQVSWALRRFSELNSKLIMVKGAPLEAMTKHQRRFYFDQGGSLVDRFGIQAVPAVVEQEGRVMRVREIPVPTRKAP